MGVSLDVESGGYSLAAVLRLLIAVTRTQALDAQVSAVGVPGL